MTRQNYYKRRRARSRKEVHEGLVVDLVRQERMVQPQLGGRKLYHMLGPELERAGVSVGRDKFFEILRCHDLLVKRLPTTPRTTNSRHSLPVFRNKIFKMELERANQVWVSDLTYIRTLEGFEYLWLIMDLWSRKVVGHHCGEGSSAIDALRALDMAVKDLPEGSRLIHHSDHGCQYCSHEYVGQLEELGIGISMTEENHCAENANAERLNGILKQEYALGLEFQTRRQARAAVAQAVLLYNNRRPHNCLGLRTPAQVHLQAA